MKPKLLIAMQALVFLLSALVACALMPVLSARAKRWRLIDVPDSRKRHARSTPLVGGMAMLLGVVASIAAFELHGLVPLAFLGMLAGLFLIGLADDLREASSVIRFVAQAAVALVAIWLADVALRDVGELVGSRTLHLGQWSLWLTVLGLIGIINAVNLSDGLDGLAGGICLTALASFYVALWLMRAEGIGPAALHGYLPLVAALMGAVAGFLVWNLRTPWRRRAAVFMGDGGSLMLGGALGWLAIVTAGQAGQPAAGGFPPVAALWVLIVPLYDTVGCMVRRLLKGQSPMRADRMHLHHLIRQRGLSVAKTVMLLIGVNALGGLVGLVSWQAGVPDGVSFVLFVSGFAVYLLVTLRYWSRHERSTLLRYSRSAPRYGVAVAAMSSLPVGMVAKGAEREKGPR